MPALPPGQQPQVAGPIHAVPCPHCGKPNDFRDLQQQQLLDTGHTVGCDHCGRQMDVVRIAPVTVISVRKNMAPPPRTQQQPQTRQATTMSAAQAQKLLRGR